MAERPYAVSAGEPDRLPFTSRNFLLQELRVATSIHRQIAEELCVREQQVEAAVALVDGGATVPFVARYRKEATGALNDAQRTLEERLHYLHELEERRAVILHSIREQGSPRQRVAA